ncbi:MAG: CoA transferase [Candidatus Nanopelagicales bacterium]|nr:CoA transferase [Candidatus Nanopelagicales bacterium]
MSEVSAPLADIVVVSVEQAISAPFATRQLADLGATVIKIERPEGDFARHYDSLVNGNSAFFVWANVGKQSVAIDMRNPDDERLLKSLIAGADVFIHNMSPSAAKGRGIDADTLRAEHSNLIVCAISGYGPDGPRSDDKAYDLAIQAEAGAFSVTGDEVMSKVGFSVADISAGMYALTSILAALVRRDRSGEGASIHVSMLEALAEWLSAPLYAATYGTGQAPRTGRRHHAIAPYGTFGLSDGRTILIAVQSDGEWQSLAAALLENPALGTDPRFVTNSDRLANVVELETLISEQLASISGEEAMSRLAAGRIAVARVNELAGVWRHEQLRARGRFHEVQTENGPVELLDPPFDISGWARPPSSIPGLNENDPKVLATIIDRGRQRGVVPKVKLPAKPPGDSI